MDVMFKQVELQRASLVEETERLYCYIAPIKRLVPDVLDRIFSQCIADDPLAPWKLAGVSASWRAALLSSSVKWSRIVLHASRFRRRRGCSEKLTAFVALWLERTGTTQPLTIEINWYTVDEPQEQQSYNSLRRVLKLVRTEASRWQQFSLAAPRLDLHTVFTPGAQPNLQSISLCSRFRRASYDLTGLTLHTLHLENVSWYPHGAVLGNLRSFSYIAEDDVTISCATIVELLRSCPELRSLTLRVCGTLEGRDARPAFPSLCLSQLKDLDICESRSLYAIWNTIRTPNLCNITFREGRWTNTSGCAKPLSLLMAQSPAPPIRSLTCHATIESDDAIRRMDSLQRLSLVLYNWTSFPYATPILPLPCLSIPISNPKFLVPHTSNPQLNVQNPDFDRGSPEVWAMPSLQEIEIIFRHVHSWPDYREIAERRRQLGRELAYRRKAAASSRRPVYPRICVSQIDIELREEEDPYESTSCSDDSASDVDSEL